MPHLVQMRDKYARDGLVVITVNLDDPADQGLKTKVTGFLERVKITLTNVMLDEKQEVWEKKFHFSGELPTTFIFNRAGKYVRFPTEDKPAFDHTDVEKVVVEFLKQK
jgi:hypothetical protein